MKNSISNKKAPASKEVGPNETTKNFYRIVLYEAIDSVLQNLVSCNGVNVNISRQDTNKLDVSSSNVSCGSI